MKHDEKLLVVSQAKLYEASRLIGDIDWQRVQAIQPIDVKTIHDLTRSLDSLNRILSSKVASLMTDK